MTCTLNDSVINKTNEICLIWPKLSSYHDVFSFVDRVVKAVNSPLRQNYSPEPEPTIVFFRNQIPVLYDGKLLLLVFLNNPFWFTVNNAYL